MAARPGHTSLVRAPQMQWGTKRTLHLGLLVVVHLTYYVSHFHFKVSTTNYARLTFIATPYQFRDVGTWVGSGEVCDNTEGLQCLLCTQEAEPNRLAEVFGNTLPWSGSPPQQLHST